MNSSDAQHFVAGTGGEACEIPCERADTACSGSSRKASASALPEWCDAALPDAALWWRRASPLWRKAPLRRGFFMQDLYER